MKRNIFSISMIIVSFLIGLVLYRELPQEIVVHWGINGEPNGYSSKLVGVLLLPGIMLGALLSRNVLPKVDPQKDNYLKFSKSYHLTLDVLVAFLLLVHVCVLLYNVGYPIHIEFIVSLGLAILYIIMGNYMPKVKHNYFMGIRTPWTLSNESVWRKTHRFAGKMFVLGGCIILIGLFTPILHLYVILISSLLVTVPSIFMSYIYYKKEENLLK